MKKVCCIENENEKDRDVLEREKFVFETRAAAVEALATDRGSNPGVYTCLGAVNKKNLYWKEKMVTFMKKNRDE
jgi:hypothetical protein